MLQIASPQERDRSARAADPPPSDFDKENPGFTRINLRLQAGANGECRITAVFKSAD
jgi:hypothetical protein